MTNDTVHASNQKEQKVEEKSTEGKNEDRQESSEQNPSSQSMDWTSYREYEKRKLESIGELTEEAMTNIEQWLMNANRIYEELSYPSSFRVYQTLTYLQSTEKIWFEREKIGIDDDWDIFYEKLRHHVRDRQQPITAASLDDPIQSTTREQTLFEQSISRAFSKYNGKSDAQAWLLKTMNLFKQYEMTSHDRLRAIPILLEDVAYIWYIRNEQSIYSFESFTKLFLHQFDKTSTSPTSSERSSLSSNLSMTMAREIIKTPTYFRGSKDDVIDWLEKLEVRFTMANWDDESKLRYIPIHLQEDAYSWWTQASCDIKTWSSFVKSITRAFGSSRYQELAFEQLQRYRQSVNQSITPYQDKVLELCRRVDVTMTEAMKLRYLMAGVKDSLKFHIVLHDPKTLESFLDYAKKVEDTMSITKFVSVSGNEFDHEVINAIHQPTNQKEFHRSMEGQRDESVMHRPRRDDETTVQRDPHQRFPSRLNRPKDAPDRKSIICYSCGTPGHYARDCARSHFE